MHKGWAIALLLGCGRALHPEAPARSAEGLLDWAARRTGPDPIQARLDLHLVSPMMSGGTNGVLVADRPGRTHLAVLGLFGSPVMTFTLDEAGVTLDLPQQKRRIVLPEAASLFGEATGGALTTNDVGALLLGEIPWAVREPLTRKRLDDGAVAATWEAERGVTVSVVLDPATGCPRELTAVLAGETVFAAEWETFALVTLADQPWRVPSHVAITAGQAELSVRYRGWKVLDPVPPVFATAPPAGFTVESGFDAGASLTIEALLGGFLPAP